MDKACIALLKELHSRPEWQRILDYLGKGGYIKPYRDGGNLTEDKKIHQWMYESGRQFENDRIISILTLNEVKHE